MNCNLEQDIKELNDDIKHLEDVLQNWHGCDACKEDHIRLLKWLKTLLSYFEKGNNSK